MMRVDDVLEVLDALDSTGTRTWLAGGWGVDALVGEETRAHRDLDLLADADQYDECLISLASLGYVVETDAMPLRIELRAPGDRWVDVHPVRFDASGHGVQGDAHGAHFDYAPDDFTSGTVADRVVRCVTVRRQLASHVGYAHRPQDEHDVTLLRGL